MSQEDDVKKPSEESIRIAMDQAWRDHHHARDQTWRALQIEAALAAGLVGVDVQIGNDTATIAAAVLVIIVSLFGVFISLRHRELELIKLMHITNCEDALGLHHKDLINNITLPSKIKLWHSVAFWKMNTALFIVRMHIAIGIFAAFFIIFRLGI